jgi:hypothetical protein
MDNQYQYQTGPSNNTSFLPLMIVIGSLIVFYSFNLSDLIRQKGDVTKQRDHLETTLAEYNKVVPQAEAINQTAYNLTKVLLELAKTSPTAKQIAQDFKIQTQ